MRKKLGAIVSSCDHHIILFLFAVCSVVLHIYNKNGPLLLCVVIRLFINY